jgi:Mrp family chromosome partitioning ATPase
MKHRDRISEREKGKKKKKILSRIVTSFFFSLIVGLVTFYITGEWINSIATIFGIFLLIQAYFFTKARLEESAKIKKIEDSFPDFLAGSATLEEIIQPTNFASLDLIAGGTRMQAGPELLGSAEMNNLIRDLRARYSVILIDSPPLGAGVDPYLLSTLAGNTIMVLRNGLTDRDFAVNKLELLDRLPVRVLGAVLNDVPATGPYRYYTYLPGYGAVAEVAEDEGKLQPA